MTEELAIPEPALNTVELITRARQALLEARTLPDFRQVMEVATVAADAAKRAARLMEAEGIAAQVVEQANEAANDAAAVRIEAQAGAGRILNEMQAQGEIAESGGRGHKSTRRLTGQKSVQEIIGDKRRPDESDDRRASSRAHKRLEIWRKVAGVSDETRGGYVEYVKANGGEITTNGLLRYAVERSSREEEEDPEATVEQAYDAVVRAIGVVTKHDPGTIAGHASNTRRRTKFRRLVEDLQGWVQKIQYIYDGSE